MSELDCFDCFVCKPNVDRSSESPGERSAPRSLCLRHKVAIKTEDGQLLKTVLAEVSPENSPLEGGLLGWIFNPVYVRGNANHETRCWTDFAAGGMAALEDRFSANTYYEFRAFEDHGAVDLLYALRLAGELGPQAVTMGELIEVVASAEADRPQDVRDSWRGPFQGLNTLLEIWCFQQELARLRTNRGHIWPRSFVELSQWIDNCREGEMEADTESSFIQSLYDLAYRRFPAGRT